VRDTGVGITGELLPHVFDLFTQADRSLARSKGGLGIGLTLVKALVEMHGGCVTAHSGGLGAGSEFLVRLPLLSCGPTTAAPDERMTGSPVAEAKRILIVEDNVDAAVSLAELVEAWGYEPRAVFHGPGALALLPEFRPQIILCDLGMPGMDGYELVRRLRQAPELDGAALVAVTGYGQEEDRRRTQAAGFHHHLTKPVDPEQLRRFLATLPATARG
jgi:CheY-like chemotaxis protein